MRSLRFALCSIALASAVGLAACGSDDDGIGATTTPTNAAASTPESSEAPSTTAATSSTMAATTSTTSMTTPSTPSTRSATSTPMAGSTPGSDGLTLEGVTWTLSDETDLGVDLAGVDVTARFEAGTVSGLSGCNRYTGTYTAPRTGSVGALTIDPNVAGTMMACPAPQSTVEAAFLAALPTVATYAIEDDRLTLSDASGTAVLVFDHVAGDELLAGEWTVTAVRSADAVSSPVEGSVLTMTFANGNVSGSAGCNTFNGTVTIVGDDVTIGPLATTRKACTDERIGQQETDFLAALESTASFSATSSMVTLLADDGTITAVLSRA